MNLKNKDVPKVELFGVFDVIIILQVWMKYQYSLWGSSMSKLKSNCFCELGRQLEKSIHVLANYPQDITVIYPMGLLSGLISNAW